MATSDVNDYQIKETDKKIRFKLEVHERKEFSKKSEFEKVRKNTVGQSQSMSMNQYTTFADFEDKENYNRINNMSFSELEDEALKVMDQSQLDLIKKMEDAEINLKREILLSNSQKNMFRVSGIWRLKSKSILEELEDNNGQKNGIFKNKDGEVIVFSGRKKGKSVVMDNYQRDH